MRNLLLSVSLATLTLFSCKKVIETKGVTVPEEKSSVEIKSISAISRHSITLDAVMNLKGSAKVITKGICVSTTPLPIIANTKVENSLALSPYTTTINGLQLNTTYYVRAFATTNKEEVYSEQVIVKTHDISTPFTAIHLTVTTTTLNSTIVTATLTDDGGANVIEKGFCYSTATNPTVSNNKAVTTNDFKTTITNLVPNSTYYIRPYAINSIGIGYGEQSIIVVDIDGNVYNSVKIGKQLWLKENLKTTKLNNGTPIVLTTENCEWGCITLAPADTPIPVTPPRYCWYDNDIAHKNVYGAIYNGTAVKTGKLAPKGWHVATHDEFGELFLLLDPTTKKQFAISLEDGKPVFPTYNSLNAPNKMIVTGREFWDYAKFPQYDIYATNESGFSAVGAGERGELSGTFVYKHTLTGFWTSTEWTSPTGSECLYQVVFSSGSPTNGVFNVPVAYAGKSTGWSLRCVKDL